MTASALEARQTHITARTPRLLNPVTGYGMAVLVSLAFWGLLLWAVF